MNRDGHVFEFETGRLKWAGDASEVAGMLQRIDQLEADLDKVLASLDRWKRREWARQQEVRAAGQTANKWFRRARRAAKERNDAQARVVELEKELRELREGYDITRGAYAACITKAVTRRLRIRKLEDVCNQAASDLRVIATLAEGSDEERAIMAIVEETVGDLLRALGVMPAGEQGND